MTPFNSKRLPAASDAIAPDGSQVRILLQMARGSMAQFELRPGQTSRAVAHKTVEEIWYVVHGEGEMWRKLGDQEDTIRLETEVCLTLPVGTHFQFRCTGREPLKVLGITMPPWPGDGEAYDVPGAWPPSL